MQIEFSVIKKQNRLQEKYPYLILVCPPVQTNSINIRNHNILLLRFLFFFKLDTHIFHMLEPEKAKEYDVLL